MPTPQFNSLDGGVVVPSSGSSADVSAVVRGILDGSNGGTGLLAQSIPRFASVGALAAAYSNTPDEKKPALAKVSNLGLYQWVPAPYGIWIPVSGGMAVNDAGTRNAVSVNSTSGGTGTTEKLVISVPAWPLLLLVHYRARVASTGSGALATANTYVNVNDQKNDAYQTVSSFPGSTSVMFPVVVPGTADGNPASFFVQGGLEFGSGAAGAQASVDGSTSQVHFTRVTATVIPLLANVGGSPF